MARKACRRKVWNLTNPISLAIEGACVMSRDKLTKIELLELQSIEAFRSGNAGLHDWRAICDLLNVAEEMANSGIGPEVLEVCERVQETLIEAKERFERTGKMGTTAIGLNLFRALAEYHSLQRTSVDLSTYEKHIRKVANRIRSSHPSVTVLL